MNHWQIGNITINRILEFEISGGMREAVMQDFENKPVLADGRWFGVETLA